MDAFLSAQNIVKRYAQHTALDGVSINMERGTVFGLLGPNGAGKTTLIRIINHITMPDSGEVTFDGHPLTQEDVSRIGYLPEERGLYRKMKVGEQAIYFAQLKGLSKADAKERLQYWFEKFDIMPWWNKKLEELSKGMQQKVQFIITILHRPPLLIFDEPFSGFDPVNAKLLKQEILSLKREGQTIIFSTHNMSSVEEVCDNIALINNANVVLSGNVHKIKEDNRTGLLKLCTTSGSLTERPDLFTIIDKEESHGLIRYSLKKQTAVSNSELIRLFSDEVEIRSFQEQMPSMNDIFLKIVGRHE